MGTMSYILPFIAALLIIIILRKKTMVWWELGLMIGGSLLITTCTSSLIKLGNDWDTEYLGGYMTKVSHYDDWDEWIERTCTREVPCGTDEDGNTIYETETYDCSYRDYHPERWTYTDNHGREEYFYTKEDFLKALRELGYPKMVFVDMDRDYYTKDGDKQDYFWDGNVNTIRALVTPHKYVNKLKDSKSIFKYESISREEAEKEGLFEYPQVIDDDQDVVLGYKVGKGTSKRFKYINSVYGEKKQFRVYILVFKDKPLDISEMQKAYWQGGNKNEFIVCLGYNTKSKKITWCNPFSWCDAPKLEVATKRYFRAHTNLDLWNYGDWLMKNLNLWKRKEFKDFDYIDSALTDGEETTLFIITLILNIVLVVFLLAVNTAKVETLGEGYGTVHFIGFKKKNYKLINHETIEKLERVLYKSLKNYSDINMSIWW